MRIPIAAHETGPWRIRDLAADFTLEDVWALPVHGGESDFPLLLEVFGSLEAADDGSLLSRASGLLWKIRELLGSLFGWDEVAERLPISGATETSLAERLPPDLRGTTAGVHFGSVPFVPVYCTANEMAAELSNGTVHGVLHLAWAAKGDGRFQGQMAVYVKPRGLLGRVYMNAIRPFRYAIVYPVLMQRLERAWNARTNLAAAIPSASP